MNVKKCRYCNTNMPSNFRFCPYCGKRQPLSIRLLILLILFVSLAAGAYILFGDTKNLFQKPETPVIQETAPDEQPAEEEQTFEAQPPITEGTPPASIKEEEDQSKVEEERLAREKAERERRLREEAARIKAERERYEREKAEKERQADEEMKREATHIQEKAEDTPEPDVTPEKTEGENEQPSSDLEKNPPAEDGQPVSPPQ